jgi:hypothetical protein
VCEREIHYIQLMGGFDNKDQLLLIYIEERERGGIIGK